jgi:hypothetical protein
MAMAHQPDQATCREMEVLVMELAIIVTLLVVLAVTAVRWGADSRTGEPSFPHSGEPRTL